MNTTTRRPWNKTMMIICAVVMVATLPFPIYHAFHGDWQSMGLWAVASATLVLCFYFGKGKASLATAIAFLILASTACSTSHYTSYDPGATNVPPKVVGMRWIDNPALERDQQDCMLELMADGSTAIATAIAPPAGVVVAWLFYGTGVDPGPAGHSLVDCWNASQDNWGSFEVYVQCYGQPALNATFTDYNQVTAYVSIPFCQCNLQCQLFSNKADPYRNDKLIYCLDGFHPECNSGASAPAANVDTPSTTQPPPAYPPETPMQPTTTLDYPLSSPYLPPQWDVNKPIDT